MGLFTKCQKLQTCVQCRVAFKPYDDVLGYKEYCDAHRKPYLDMEFKLSRVKEWAARHPNIIEKLMQEEDEQRIKNSRAAAGYSQQAMANQANAYAQAAAQQQYSNPLGGLQS